MKLHWRKGLEILVGIAVLLAGRAIWYEGSPRSVLENSDKFILYSLSGYRDGTVDQSDLPTVGVFHHIGILSQKEITDPKLRAKLVGALYGGLRGSQPQYSCFVPHDGIRAIRDGRTVDVVICFGCGKMDFYENGQIKYENHSIPKKAALLFGEGVKEARLPPPPSHE